MSTITIASIEIKPKRSIAISTEGNRFGFWQDDASKLNLHIGSTYEVETSASEYNGKTLVNIKKARLVAATATAAPPPASNSAGISSQFRTPEQMFVSEVLTAYIGNGRCDPEKLTETILYIRKAWKHTFGDTTFVLTKDGPRSLERVA